MGCLNSPVPYGRLGLNPVTGFWSANYGGEGNKFAAASNDAWNKRPSDEGIGDRGKVGVEDPGEDCEPGAAS